MVLNFLRWLIPHFATDDVALAYTGQFHPQYGYRLAFLCEVDDLQPGQRYDLIASASTFCIFGYTFVYRLSNFRRPNGAAVDGP